MSLDGALARAFMAGQDFERETSNQHAPPGGWAAQPAKMHRRVHGDSTQRAYEAREHMEESISKPGERG